MVVVEDGSQAQWVRNALANNGCLKIHLRGVWRPARLRIIGADPETWLHRMNRVHASFVRLEASTPAVVEIVPEALPVAGGGTTNAMNTIARALSRYDAAAKVV
jgi:hypothetical protein